MILKRDLTEKDYELYSDLSTGISVEELEELMFKLQDFYEERENPKMNVFWLADNIIKRLRNDLDLYVNCEGMRGYGKSNLMLLLALTQMRYAGIWQNKYTKKLYKVLPTWKKPSDDYVFLQPSFDFERNMSFLDDVETLKNKFNSIDQYSPLIIDEGSKNLHRQQWHTKVQFELVRMSDTERYQNKCVYICFPNFKELNSIFRNDRILMRLYVFYRSKAKGFASAIISMRDVNRWVLDPWWMDENAKRFENYLKRYSVMERTPDKILRAEQKLKGYVGHFEFPSLAKLAPRIWQVYYKYKIRNAQKVLKEDEEEKPTIKKYKEILKNTITYLRDNYQLSYDTISSITNLSQNQIKSILKFEGEVSDKIPIVKTLK